MKQYFRVFTVLLAILTACKQAPVEPTIMDIVPSSIGGEPGTAHELQLRVNCDQAFTVSVEDADWLTLVGTEATGVTNRSVATFRLAAFVGSGTRTAKVKVTSGTKTTEASISQNAYGRLPVADFDSSPLGLYSTAGTLRYSKYEHQTVRLGGSSRGFRLIDPGKALFFECKGLPETWEDGSEVAFTMNQNVDARIATGTTKALVYKQDGDNVWLITPAGAGLIICK